MMAPSSLSGESNVKMTDVKNQQEALNALMEHYPELASDLVSRRDIWMCVKLGICTKTGRNKLVVVCNSGMGRELNELVKKYGIKPDWRDIDGYLPVLRAYW
jgi:pheromone shutdown protein TraB